MQFSIKLSYNKSAVAVLLVVGIWNTLFHHTVPIPLQVSPIAPIVGLHLAGGAYAIRTVTIDAGGVLKSKILNHESYGVFNDGEPSTEEQDKQCVIHKQRKLAGDMMVDGIISDSYNESVPESIGELVVKVRRISLEPNL